VCEGAMGDRGLRFWGEGNSNLTGGVLRHMARPVGTGDLMSVKSLKQ
jgi:hypothetical protein